MFENRPIAEDAARVLETLRRGGVAIFPVSVGYAVVGHDDDAIRRIYAAKQRSPAKPCGNFADWRLFTEIVEAGDRARQVVRAVTIEHDLPFSIVAPFRADHPHVLGLGPFALANATKAGTMDLLLNAGPLHDEIARLARESAFAVVGSSANLSLTGSKFRFEDIEAPVREAADLAIDYGLCPFHNTAGLGSTIVDLASFETIRVGCVYDRICTILESRFAIDLKAIMAAKRAG